MTQDPPPTGDGSGYRVYKLRRPEGVARFRIDYEGSLNPEQCEAALALEGPVLVVAGAGTGKTRTLIYRVARIVESGTAADRVALLTFTRRAAQEMVGRVERLLGRSCEGIEGGTYHGFASRMLRRYPPEGYPNRFSILDRGDAEDVIQLVRGERGTAKGAKRFPKKGTLGEIFTRAVNRDLSIEEVLERDFEQFAHHAEPILEIRRAYEAFKTKHALLDYDDLLVKLADALRTDGAARRELTSRFQHVLVDEYQDTNPLQAEITDLLASGHGNLMVVGDDAQSIYSFRGADYRNILRFPERHPDARTIKLERNYRSTQEILDVANAIIADAREGFEKRLYTDAEPGERPAVVMTGSLSEEAAFVVQRVLEHREEGASLSEMAVLFRSSHQSYELELELGRRNVPYVKYGGFKFLEAAHVKDVLAHLRVVANPDDAVAWTRVLGLLPGIGPRRAATIREAAMASGDPFRVSGVSGRSAQRRALGRLEALFGTLRAEGIPPAGMLGEVIRYYEPLARDRYDDHPRRLTDLEHVQVISEGYRSIDSLLADMSLDPPDRQVDAGLESPLDEGERLVLSTIHSAKGMEWRHVFVIGAVDGYFPSPWSARDPLALEEERRLLYVALTRARQRLYVSYPVGIFHTGTGRVLTQPSRFLDSAPDGSIERWAVSE